MNSRREHNRCSGGLLLRYKVVEIPVVTDEAIEAALNQLTAQGWQFDTLQFVVREASKRPAMAFAIFTRRDDPAG